MIPCGSHQVTAHANFSAGTVDLKQFNANRVSQVNGGDFQTQCPPLECVMYNLTSQSTSNETATDKELTILQYIVGK